jgi:putative adenylate-forming enzyme
VLATVRHYLRARRDFHALRGEALERFQDSRARAIIEHACRHSAFYRQHLAGLDPAAWRRFPIIDKQGMMERFSDFNTAGVTRQEAMEVALRAETDRDFRPTLRGLTVGLSSGTSGHRGLFLVDGTEQAAWAGVVLARMLPSLRPVGFRVAFFLRSSSNLYSTLRSRWIDFRYFDLMTPLPAAIAALNAFQPDILAGPPSLLGFLAQAADCNELRIRPLKVVSFAEVLESHDRARIAASFQQPVHEVYQCTEGLLAMTCPEGSLHVQEDLVAMQAQPLGEGRVTPVVTDLWRRVQPFIRYRMNDVVTFAEGECRCGSAFRVLERIEGRCDDVCYFEDPQGARRPVFPDAIRRMVLLADPGIRDYQAIQEADGRLRIRLEVSEGTRFEMVAEAVRRSVERGLAEYECRLTALAIHEGLEPVAERAKRRRVRRERD